MSQLRGSLRVWAVGPFAQRFGQLSLLHGSADALLSGCVASVQPGGKKDGMVKRQAQIYSVLNTGNRRHNTFNFWDAHCHEFMKRQGRRLLQLASCSKRCLRPISLFHLTAPTTRYLTVLWMKVNLEALCGDGEDWHCTHRCDSFGACDRWFQVHRYSTKQYSSPLLICHVYSSSCGWTS